MEPTSPLVWFVTGASRGLGRAFTEAALDTGDQVVATARRPEALDALRARHVDRLTVLPLDVTDRDAVRATVARAIAAYGHLDVVVNNAGRGLVGAVEEVTEDDVRDAIDTNFLGALWVTQAVLPHLRQRRSGHVVQVSTVGGVGTMPLLGLYNAAKWALEGFSEALAQEVAPFGVRVTIAEPGGFATDWAWSSMRFAPCASAYDRVREAVFGTNDVPWDVSKQAAAPGEGRPADAARALVEHVRRPDGPLRLLVGDDAPRLVRIALERRRDDYRRDPRFTWPG